MKNKEEERELETVVLEDSEGTEMPFEMLSTVKYNDAEYAVFLPQMNFGDDDELVILKIVRDKNGSIQEYHGIDDFDVLEAVFELFCKETDDK